MSKRSVVVDNKLREVGRSEFAQSNQFVPHAIALGEKWFIALTQEARLRSFLSVSGDWEIEGEVVIDDPPVPSDPFPELPDDNFSFFEIPSGVTKVIEQYQEMIVSTFCDVTGFLEVDGFFSVLGNLPEEVKVPERLKKIIPLGSLFFVPQDEEYQFRGWFSVAGSVNNMGFITLE